MAIWLPLDVYARVPVLLPWVVRDSTSRGDKKHGRPDEWGSPNADGYLRDDNSLVKGIPKSLSVRGPGHLRGARMGTEFVAAHVWRKVRHADLASRIPLLNSFVPNLVWLPAQVAKLTDLEGGVVQKTLQAMSRAVYRPAPVSSDMRQVVESAWDLLPEPEIEVSMIDHGALNWFEATEAFIDRRLARISTVIRALEIVEAGQPLTRKVITRRYTEGLSSVPTEKRRALLEGLRFHVARPMATATE